MDDYQQLLNDLDKKYERLREVQGNIDKKLTIMTIAISVQLLVFTAQLIMLIVK